MEPSASSTEPKSSTMTATVKVFRNPSMSSEGMQQETDVVMSLSHQHSTYLLVAVVVLNVTSRSVSCACEIWETHCRRDHKKDDTGGNPT